MMIKRKPITAQMRDEAWLLEFGKQFGRYPRCPECGELMIPGQRIHMDHRHEVADGGPHVIGNLRPIHYDPCHKRKTRKSTKQRAHIKRLAKGPRKRKGPPIKSKPFPKQKRPMR